MKVCVLAPKIGESEFYCPPKLTASAFGLRNWRALFCFDHLKQTTLFYFSHSNGGFVCLLVTTTGGLVWFVRVINIYKAVLNLD